jgi:hypothetical protein
MRQVVVIAAALVLAGSGLQADDRTYEQRFSEEYARLGPSWVTNSSLVDTNNQGPFFGQKELPFSRFRAAGELRGIKLGMTMSEVVAVWGKPRQLFTHCGIGPRFSYRRYAFLFFRENRLVRLSLSDPLLADLVFDNGLKAGIRRPEVEAVLGPSTQRAAKRADDWRGDLTYVSGGVCMSVAFHNVSRTPTSAFQDAEEVDSIAVGFEDEFNRRKSGEPEVAPNADPPHR